MFAPPPPGKSQQSNAMTKESLTLGSGDCAGCVSSLVVHPTMLRCHAKEFRTRYDFPAGGVRSQARFRTLSSRMWHLPIRKRFFPGCDASGKRTTVGCVAILLRAAPYSCHGREAYLGRPSSCRCDLLSVALATQQCCCVPLRKV